MSTAQAIKSDSDGPRKQTGEVTQKLAA